MKNTIVCPVSAERTDGTVVRIIAGLIALLAITGIILKSEIIFLFLSLDFALRTFGLGKISVLRLLAVSLKQGLGLSSSVTDASAKRFAASLGLGLTLSILISILFHLDILAVILSVLLITCALLESIVNICLGCYVYTFIHLLKQRLK